MSVSARAPSLKGREPPMCNQLQSHDTRNAGSFVCDDLSTSPTAAHARKFPRRASASRPAAVVTRMLAMRRGCGLQVADAGNSNRTSHVQRKRPHPAQGQHGIDAQPQVRRFAKADLLIEDGKISEISPISPYQETRWPKIDALDQVVIPGFVDATATPMRACYGTSCIRGCSIPTDRDIRTTLTRLSGRGCVCRSGHGARHDRHWYDCDGRHFAGLAYARAQRRLRSGAAGIRHPCVMPTTAAPDPAAQYPQDIKRLQRTYLAPRINC